MNSAFEARLHYTTFSQLIQEGVLCEGHPAGVQVFIWYWSKVVGYSELALRLPFLILGILCIPLAYKVEPNGLTTMWVCL